ncbi:MAG TPA: ATP-binding cassette domain-containing protein [Caulobacterales bacterium]|nr:ATP-binding cassette domain-containing protein [Caulobacterales bacterium]
MARPPKPEYTLYERGVRAQLSDVSAGYDGSDVLIGVNFEARAGEVAFVSGPTSAGKTTFIHVLRLALLPRAGRTIILGEDIQRLNAGPRAKMKRRIGYIAENPVFVEDWTGFENIAVALKLAGRRPRSFAEDVDELAQFVGLADEISQPVRSLSNAARRRVAIARALAGKPELILADDPTAGMSPDAGRRIVRLLAEMRRVGAAVVITSQDEGLADYAPGARWRMEHGRPVPAEDVEEAEA